MEQLRSVVKDDYKILALLGFGGMAGVYLAREKRPPRNVAIKVMSPELMLGGQMVERFHLEAALQANLEHPNIAAIYAVREQGGLQFFTMQYIPGRTLQGALRAEVEAGRRLSPAVVGALLHQVGSALEYAHAADVIHRDVKPGNVMLARDGRALLTDFGIAKMSLGPGLTMTNAALGTVAYMSPEQCYAERNLTGASDQYSLGILAYELLAGSVPFTGDAFRVQQAHVSTPPPPLEQVRDDCPAQLASGIARMLAKDPRDRFPDIASALDAMGVKAPGPRRDDPVRRELIRLADCEGVWARLNEDARRELLTPRSAEVIAISDPGPLSTIPRLAHDATVSSLHVDELPSVLALGEIHALRVTCKDASGSLVQNPNVSWRIDPPMVCEIGEGHTLRCLRWGRATIRASAGAASVEVPLLVGSVPLRAIELLRVPTSIIAGASARTEVRVVDVAGRPRAIPYSLVSSNQTVLATESDGTLHALRPGSAEIIARCGTYECRATISVTT